MDLEKVGNEIGKIKVTISYRIIELFSKGLYSSPNKAFEELVCNAFDAEATEVSIYIPDNIENTPYIWVLDNGEGMNVEGLKELWQVGKSKKRNEEKSIEEPSKGWEKKRKQIGKFGIGKLATYIITNKLTYLSRTENGYYATTMDYSLLPQENIAEVKSPDEAFVLSERVLSEAEARKIVSEHAPGTGKKVFSFNPFGKDAPKSWTFCLMTALKPAAGKITTGRLEWILRTALPLNPNFVLFLNGNLIESSKIATPLIEEWILGSLEDKVAQREKGKKINLRTVSGEPVIDLPHLNNVRGNASLYQDSIAKGKSEEIGRSNGIFLKIRGRLINLDDPLLGIAPLQHSAFARTRITVYADDLDQYLTSGRESIQDGPHLNDLREYLNSFFYSVIKPRWDTCNETATKKDLAFHKLLGSSGNLTKIPLSHVVKKVAADQRNDLLLNRISPSLAIDPAFIESIETDIFDEKGIIKNIERVYLGPEQPLAILDYSDKTVKVNIAHPYIAAVQEDMTNPHPIEMMAIAEILTEAQMIEFGFSQDAAHDVMEKRDRTLRTLAYGEKKSATNLAIMLDDAVSNEKPLEDILCECFRSLGYDVNQIGGSGEPDGVAVACLGFLNQKDCKYGIILDAKSTVSARVKTGNVHIDISDVHREKYHAQYVVIVGKDFDGSEAADSLISKNTKLHKVTCIKARDLSRLLFLASPKMLTLTDLRDMLDTCHTPEEVTQWVDELQKRPVVKNSLIQPFIDTVYKVQKEDREPPYIPAIRVHMQKDYPELDPYLGIENLEGLANSLMKIIPQYINIENGIVTIATKPERISQELHQAIKSVTPAYYDLYLKTFQ
jgi:hypothetical protein